MRMSLSKAVTRVAMIGLAATLSYTALPSISYSAEVQASQQASAPQQATELTQALMGLQKQWASAQGAGKARALEQLVAKAEERRTFLIQLINNNPATVLNATIPQETQAGMPEEVLEKLEHPVELQGEYEAFYEEDFDSKTVQLHHFVNTPFGERFKLHFSSKTSPALSGQTVHLDGVLFPEDPDSEDVDGQLLLDDSGILIMGATGGDNGGTPGVLPNTFGERKVAVFLINFQDQPDNKPWSAAEVNDTIFGEVNNFIMENSYQQTWLSGDVFGWFTVPLDGATTCDGTYDDLAEDMATADGVDLSAYDHFIYIVPPTTACKGDVASVGGVPTHARISSGNDKRIIAHEFGHNLGLYHARALNCTDGVLTSDCQDFSYGDILDTMGNKFGHYNAFNKERLGWLNNEQSPSLETVTTDGTYIISPIEQPGQHPAALKVQKSAADSSWYYLEYRQPIGIDSGLFSDEAYQYPENIKNGLIIRKAVEGDGSSSYLLDMTPDSTFYDVVDLNDPALEVGTSYSDADAGVTISVTSNDASGITVDVSLSDFAEPTNSAPVAIDDQASTEEGSAVSIAVLENDYDPDGDSLSLDSTSAINGTALIQGNTILFSPAPGFTGFEVFNYAVSDGRGGSATGSVTVEVTAGQTNTAPVAINDSASLLQGQSTNIPVLENDYDTDGDTLSITAVSGAAGTVTIEGNAIAYTPANGFNGVDSFSYTIADGKGGSDTGVVTITVEAGNQAPVANSDNITMSSESTITIAVLDNDYDPDGDALVIASVTQGSKGQVSISGNKIIYAPAKSFKDSDSFTYVVTDGSLSSETTVSLTLQSDATNTGSPGKGNGKR